MNDAKVKDEILLMLNKRPSEDRECSITDIAASLNIEFHIVRRHFDELISMQLVDTTEFNHKGVTPGNLIVRINHRGQFFIENEGGYTSMHARQKKAIAISKTTHAGGVSLRFLHAVLTLLFAGWSVKLTYDAHKNEDELKLRDSKIERLETKIDSLNAFHNKISDSDTLLNTTE